MRSDYSNAKLFYLLSSRLVRRLACRSLDSVIMKGCQLLETAGCALLKLRKLLRYLFPKIPLHAVEGRKFSILEQTVFRITVVIVENPALFSSIYKCTFLCD